MFAKYRNTLLSTRLIVLGSILLLTSVISLRFNYDLRVALGAVVGLALAVHILSTKPKTTFSIIICFLQLIAISYASYTLGYVLSTIGLDQVFFTIVIGSVLVTTSLIITYIAFRFSIVKVWLTLALSFAALDVSGFVVGEYTAVNPIVSLLISAAAGLATVILCSLPIFRHKTNDTVVHIRDSIRNSTANKTAKEIFTKNEWNYEEKIDYKNVFILNTPHMNSIVFALNFSDKLSKSKKDVHYKGISLGNFFNDLIEEARKISLKEKIKNKTISVVIMDTSNKYSLPANKFEEIHIYAKNDSRDRKDRVIVSNNQGLVNYVKSVKP